MTAQLQRSAFVRIYERGDSLSVIAADGSVRRFNGASAELTRAVLDFLCEPDTQDELVAHVSELSGRDASGVVGETVAALQGCGVVEDAAMARPAATDVRARIVVALSGGIAAAHAPLLAEVLFARGFLVRFAATESALRFVSSMALSALTHQPVVTSLWPKDETEPAVHIALARWADAVVVYPATATTLSRIATGDCSTVVSALAISARSPVLLVPAMNEDMFRSASARRNLTQLREDGFFIAHPSLGYEVATAPEDRQSTFGGAPPVAAVADIVEAIVAEARVTSDRRSGDASK